MKKIRRIFLWYFLLNKRLFKKVSFLVILAAIPVLTAALGAAAQEDSGILTVALSLEDPSDTAASAAVEKIMGDSEIIRYELYGEPEDAKLAVKHGEADAAWIFAEDMQEKMDEFVSGKPGRDAVVKIIEREENVFLQLAREKLFAALYSGMSHAIYTDFMLTKVDPGADAETMQRHYDVAAVDRDIIQFAFMDESVSSAAAEEADYITAPVRGFLALMIILVGLASAMYLMQDEQSGNYTWLPAGVKLPFSYGWYLIAITDAAVIVCLSLAAAGLFTQWQREIPLMLLYCAACAGFCNLVKMLCGKMERLGVAIPVLMLLMLVLSPVFLNVRRLRIIQYLLPPFYYLHGVNNGDFALLLAGYTAAVYVLGFAVWKIKKRYE